MVHQQYKNMPWLHKPFHNRLPSSGVEYWNLYLQHNFLSAVCPSQTANW